jgi:hypothetical protein
MVRPFLLPVIGRPLRPGSVKRPSAASRRELPKQRTARQGKTYKPQIFSGVGSALTLRDYPLVTMDLTRKQLTNVDPGKGFGGPMNTFANVPAYPAAEDRAVVRPNFDTLYSSAWLDLTKEPMVVSVPDTNGRYYLLPILDMWTDVFASPGWRTTGTQAQTLVIVPLGWRPDLQDRLIDN